MSDQPGHLLDSITGRQRLIDRFERIERLLTERAEQTEQHLGRIDQRLDVIEERLRQLEQAGQSSGLPYATVAQLRELDNRVVAEALIRARCMVVPVDGTTALCRILGRYKMYVDLRDKGFAPHLMYEGFWEYWLTEFIWRNVKPGQVALDVGANHGYYALLMADLVGPEGQVHAFEPNPRMVQLLRDTAALNGFWQSIRVHPCAVGERAAAAVRFLASVAEPKNGRLLSERDAAGTGVLEVPIISLDEALPGRVDFVKIDVEGAEELVWRGMQEVIDRNPEIQIVLEFNASRCSSPLGTLNHIASRFPLREIGFDGQVHACAAEELLGRSEDALLYLSTLDPA
ncbi:FkbM family methyltransferase [Roseomonas sp. HJA6]|uniref:FkbM family methyltransferase n=1 Tax=Roseomonas alba TaxID=2846776 RepID=A0ABS7A4E7_9PROT|nr:FkbM family methyltransferase [Neoroseomonas alba]MBW6397171.1 FkbM family methyltransferase [Neoroseomonas alba]